MQGALAPDCLLVRVHLPACAEVLQAATKAIGLADSAKSAGLVAAWCPAAEGIKLFSLQTSLRISIMKQVAAGHMGSLLIRRC